MKRTWALLKETFNQWNEHDVIEYSAALAYFTVFSLAPLLLIAIAIAGVVYGPKMAQEQVTRQVSQTVGPQATQFIQKMLEQASRPGSSTIASIIGGVTLLFGAMRIFDQLKKMLNKIWNVSPPQKSVIARFVFDYLLAFVMVLLIGVLFLGLIVASTAFSAATKVVGTHFGGSPLLWQSVNQVGSLLVFTLLFALIYKVLPDVKIAWSDVWLGGFVTSALFTIGKYLIGLYVRHGGVASPYGAAGSLVVLLVFIYYSALILFFGAEFTAVYARECGSLRSSPAAAPQREAAETHGAPPTLRPAPAGGKMIFGIAALAVLRRVFIPGHR